MGAPTPREVTPRSWGASRCASRAHDKPPCSNRPTPVAVQELARLLANLGHVVEEASRRSTMPKRLLLSSSCSSPRWPIGWRELALGRPRRDGRDRAAAVVRPRLLPSRERRRYRTSFRGAGRSPAPSHPAFMADYDLPLMLTGGLRKPIAIGALLAKQDRKQDDLASATRFEPLCRMIIKELAPRPSPGRPTPNLQPDRTTGHVAAALHWSAARDCPWVFR